MSSKILQAARVAHEEATGHTKIIIGANYVKCQECGCVAHSRRGRLLIHDHAYTMSRIGGPSDFVWRDGEAPGSAERLKGYCVSDSTIERDKRRSR